MSADHIAEAIFWLFFAGAFFLVARFLTLFLSLPVMFRKVSNLPAWWLMAMFLPLVVWFLTALAVGKGGFIDFTVEPLCLGLACTLAEILLALFPRVTRLGHSMPLLPSLLSSLLIAVLIGLFFPQLFEC